MYRRGSLFWGGVLIVMAALLLLKQAGVIVGDIFGYFWPLLIIAFGIWLITGYFTRNQPTQGEQVSIPLEGERAQASSLTTGLGNSLYIRGPNPTRS
jgi:hypothetical protein